MTSETKEPFAAFSWQLKRDAEASKEAGRPQFKKVAYVTIRHPGRKDYELVAEATDDHKKRFARAWQAFKEMEEEPEDGTPLKMVPIFSMEDIEHLKLAGIKTLEKFVSLSDEELRVYPAIIQDLKKPAMAYLEAASDRGALAMKFSKSEEIRTALEEEVKTLKASLAKADTEIETLKSLVNQAPAAEPKTPKRKTLTARAG